MKRRRRAAALAASLVCGGFAMLAPLCAQDVAAPTTLIPGKGASLTMAKCSLCHDITHVTRTRLSRAEWEDNIKVMIARGMPIEPSEIPIVLDYLAAYYNRDAPPPAAAPGNTAEEAPIVRHGCTACHAADGKLVGPSFREIAGRYKGDAGAAGKLAMKVKEGGAGSWGTIPMPAHPQLAAAEIEALVAWVLQQ